MIPTTTTEERPHAERSSSQLGNLALCEGYRPRRNAKKHWVTEQGERGHEALEDDNTEDLESTFEERMVELCEEYISKLPHAIIDLKEIKVTTIMKRWGYVDRVRFRCEEVADLVDWKFVRVKEVTDAEVNLQGKDYVVGLFEEYPKLMTIHVHFVMPRFNSVTTATFTREDAPRLKLEIFAVLRKAQRSDSKNYKGKTLTPHFDVCKYCGAAGNCVALRKINDELARKYDPNGYGKLPPVPEETHSSKVKDPAQRAQLQMLAAIAEEFAKSVRYNNLTAAMDNPADIPTGYEIDYRKGKRRVTSPAGLMLVASEFGLTSDDLLACSSFAWTRIEEMVRERSPKGQKARRVAAFNDRLRELNAVDRGEEIPTLARVSG